MDMLEGESEFVKALEVFRQESESAAQYFYAYLAVHESARQNKSIVRALNRQPLFWNTSLSALQTSALLTLGRIFDKDPRAHRVDRLVSLAGRHRDIFSRDALRRRKIGSGPVEPEWLEGYLETAVEPSQSDLRALKRQVAVHRDLFESKLAPLRHRVIAHKEIASPADVASLWSAPREADIRRLIVFLTALHEALWETFHNGRRLALRRHRFSATRVRELISTATHPRGAHERVVADAAVLLRQLAQSNKRLQPTATGAKMTRRG